MKIIFFKNKDQIQTNLLDFPKIQTNIFFASPILDKDIQHLCAGQIIQPPSPPPGQPRSQRKYACDKTGGALEKWLILLIM